MELFGVAALRAAALARAAAAGGGGGRGLPLLLLLLAVGREYSGSALRAFLSAEEDDEEDDPAEDGAVAVLEAVVGVGVPFNLCARSLEVPPSAVARERDVVTGDVSAVGDGRAVAAAAAAALLLRGVVRGVRRLPAVPPVGGESAAESGLGVS